MELSRGARLPGGNVADAVVRIGATVRKPPTPATPAVEALLEHLAAVGFPAAPRTLGRDDIGRHVLEYVPGETADRLRPLTADELRRLGALVREFHDAVEGFQPPPDAQWDVAVPPDRADLICHNDLAPWNLVRSGDRWVFIDWDGAGPGCGTWRTRRTASSRCAPAANPSSTVPGCGLSATGTGSTSSNGGSCRR